MRFKELSSDKKIWFLTVAAVGIGFLGTILLFCSKFDLHISYAAPEMGIMPLVGTLFMGVSLVLFLKKKDLILARGIFGALGGLVSFMNVIMVVDYGPGLSAVSFVGYAFCVIASASVIAASVLTFKRYAVISKEEREKRAAAQSEQPSFDAEVDYLAFSTELDDLKKLREAGVFSEEEYAKEKARIFSDYGFTR